jgi:hypothetical protein
MAVQSDTSSISYTGNNSTSTSYAVPFVFLENAHLAATAKVTATGVESVVTLTNHTGAGNVNGGTVRTSVAIPATSTLTIFRTVPATQTTTYQEGGDFPAASHERALDKLTMLGQQNARKNDRALRVTEADGSRNEVVAVANSIIGLDGSKQPKAMTASEVKTFLALTGVTLDVAAGMKTFADSGERALAVPDFTGQLGTQRDTADIYIATGTAAGNWSLVDENISLADLASGFFTADATGRGKFGSGFVDSTLLATNAVETAKIANANVTPAKLSQPFTLVTSVASTSATSIDFMGIPSWVKKITVMLNVVSMAQAAANLLIQVGVEADPTTSGYSSYGMNFGTSGGNGDSFINGFGIKGNGNANDTFTGLMTIANFSGNTWVAHGGFANQATSTGFFSSGGVTLSGTLARVRITPSTGNFDAGSISISYEG